MNFDYMAAHMLCTEEEKLIGMETVDKLLTMAKTARRCGLLELEKLLQEERYASPPLLRIGAELILDGADPAIVRQILENYIITSNFSNQEFFENMLALTGILALQQGENPSHFRELLTSFFGVGFREKLLLLFEQEDEKLSLEEFFRLYTERLMSFPKVTLMDFIAENMENNGIQRIIRETDFTDLNCALAGSCMEVIKMFLKNMGTGRRFSFYDFINNSWQLDASSIERCQKNVIAVMHKLRNQGEIVVEIPVLK